MPKRCETINRGDPCFYLATDGSCLLRELKRVEECPARETVEHEQKDTWMFDFPKFSKNKEEFDRYG